jgi:hypothetical protein
VSLRDILRKVFLSIAIGGHSILGVGMSQEKIEELLHAMNETRAEVSVSDDKDRDLKIETDVDPIDCITMSAPSPE